MRCYPRKGRQLWVAFLLAVCLVGVYMTYRQLQESEPVRNKLDSNDHKLERIQQQLQQKAHGNLKLPRQPKLADGDTNGGVVEAVRNKIEDKILPPVFPAGRVLENDDDYVTDEEKYARLKLLLHTLSPVNWKTTLDPDEMIFLTKSEFMDLGIESKLSCKQIDSMKASYARQQGFYGKKIIDYVQKDAVSDYVLKSVGRDQQLKIECMKMDYNEDRCHLMGNYKLVKELVMFNILDHSSIIKLEGFCLRGETIDPRVKYKGAIIVTESGKQMQNDLYQWLPWATKVEIVIQLMKLLQYLENSLIGSLGFEKLQINDFVMLKSDIKLVDLDNLVVGEKSCQRSEECIIPEVSSKEIKCVENVCKGRNVMKNLYLLNLSVLGPLLNYSPDNEVKQMLDNIEKLRFTPQEIINWFQKHTESAGKPVVERNKDIQRDNEIQHDNDIQAPARERVVTARPADDVQRQIRVNKVLGAETDVGAPNSYSRQGNANFPGRYDYSCGKSRVSWGCVLTVKSLDEAKSLCDSDANCAAFIVFSSNPESDAMMTMVMKNSADGNPEPNYGATMFRKKHRKEAALERINAEANEDSAVKEMSQLNNAESRACIVKASNATDSARQRREKRLLVHLGLRGISEYEWTTYAESTQMLKYLGPSQLSSASVKGGRFKFTFASNTLSLKKGEFLAEMGPKYYHMAYLTTYHLDRILGLYHTPPTVLRTVPLSELKYIQGDKFPLQSFLNISDGSSLKGVVTVPMPPVMKTDILTIEKKEHQVTMVPEFSRNQKGQLEYILLWALTRMMQPQHGYLGYKGHLIHFEADLAFQNLQKSLTGYFYNCQFPNTVYKTLVCYKCPESKKSSTICGLGEEVVRRLKNNGYTGSEIRVGSLTGRDIMNIIDSNASAIFQVVEQCIKTFTREKVLY